MYPARFYREGYGKWLREEVFLYYSSIYWHIINNENIDYSFAMIDEPTRTTLSFFYSSYSSEYRLLYKGDIIFLRFFKNEFHNAVTLHNTKLCKETADYYVKISSRLLEIVSSSTFSIDNEVNLNLDDIKKSSDFIIYKFSNNRVIYSE
jgi:hypothetical protein